MTDYIDGELKEKMRIRILNHLTACEECRQFEGTLQKETGSLFKAAEKKTPPDFIWEKIKDRIIIGEKNAFRVIRIFKPAFAIPAIAIVMLIAVFVIRFPLVERSALNTYITDQTEFIMDLGQNGIDVPDEGLGTSIEEFLLS
jgi:predicted anti-sigma-YlaC factor YlaD